ncbi:hypothetical protein [Mucilaginibacter sp.]|uniref:hypothetical protein n=1 Tax=Mucilaginibacter sp. TaxID=1882438 RepID=UPI003266F99C
MSASFGYRSFLTANSRAPALPDIFIAICIPFIFLLYATRYNNILKQACYLPEDFFSY